MSAQDRLHYDGAVNTRFTLDVDKRGRVTLPQEVLDHLAVKPGAKLKLTYLPDGECLLQALRPLHAKGGSIVFRRHVPRTESANE